MGFTQITVSGDRQLPDGSPATGSIVFTPTAAMRNSTAAPETTVNAPTTMQILDGAVSGTLAATNDPGTTPTGVTYRVDEHIMGLSTVRTYWLAVAFNGGAIDLDTVTIIETYPGAIVQPGPPGPTGPQGTTGSVGPPGSGTNLVVPTVAADGVTDDRAAINAALAAIPADGRHYTLWLPGMCFVSDGPFSGGQRTGIVIPRSNITLAGERGAGLWNGGDSTRLVIVAGGALLPGGQADPLKTTEWITSLVVTPFAGPVTDRATVVALTSAGHGLVAGDWVFLRTGQLTADPLAREPDSEVNQVQAVAGANITLARPTAKPYQQEYLQPSGFGDTTPTATPLPFGLCKITDRLIRNVRIAGLRIWSRPDGAAGGPVNDGTAIFLHQAQDVMIDDVSCDVGKYGIAARYARDVTIDRAALHAWGTSDGDPGFLAPSTGCGDWLARSCRSSGAVPGKLHSHEGIHDYTVLDYRQRTPDGPGRAGASNISVRTRAYRHSYDTDIEGLYTAGSCDGVRVTRDAATVAFPRLRLRGSPGRSHVNIESPGARISPGGLDLPPSALVTTTTGTDPLGER